MTILVIAEHDNALIKPATLNTVTAAAIVSMFTDAEIHLLVAGCGAHRAADAASHIAGVTKVLSAEAPQLTDDPTGDFEATVLAIVNTYSHVFAPATPYGERIAPRIAAKLDVTEISDVTAIDLADTFECTRDDDGNAAPIFHSDDRIKIVKVQTSSFDPAAAQGGSAAIEKIVAAAAAGAP